MPEPRIARRIREQRPGVNERFGKAGRPTLEQAEAHAQALIEQEASQPIDPYSAVERLLGRELTARERMSFIVSHSWSELFA